MDATTAVAFYGAALSSFVFGWNVMRDLRDRGHLTVSPSVAQVLNVPGVAPGSPQWKLHLRITNTGRRQLWITNVGGRREVEKGFVLISRNRLPMKLEPGQLIDEAPPVEEIADPLSVAYFSAYDSTGREYRSSVRETWRAISALLEAQGKDHDLSWGFKLTNLARRARLRIDQFLGAP